MRLSKFCFKALVAISVVIVAEALFLLLVGALGFETSALAGILVLGLRPQPTGTKQDKKRETGESRKHAFSAWEYLELE